MESSYCQQAVTFFSFGLQLTVPDPLTLWPAPPPLQSAVPHGAVVEL